MKFKAKIKDCQLTVKVKTTSDEVIDERELDRFARIFLRGFLKPKWINRNKAEYRGPVGISLYERLKKPLKKRDFLFILEQVVVAVQKLQANNLAINNLVMDLRQVYINEITKEVQFIFLPISFGLRGPNLIEFFEMIAYSVKPGDAEDNEFVSRFVYFFKAMSPFDLDQIEAFVAKEDRSVVGIIKKQNAGQSGFMTNKQRHYLEHYEKAQKDEEATDRMDDDPTGLLEDDDPTGLLSEDDDPTGLLLPEDEEATGLLDEEEEEEPTGLLLENNASVHFPSLFRISTGEEISVNKPVFRLGKEKSYVDYFVGSNIVVSRSHADIVTRGNKYFVKDLNSKNHTFINNQELPAHAEIEIQDGARLRLGNEEFIFNVPKGGF